MIWWMLLFFFFMMPIISDLIKDHKKIRLKRQKIKEISRYNAKLRLLITFQRFNIKFIDREIHITHAKHDIEMARLDLRKIMDLL